ncbi:CHAT domain-containing protein [Aeromonas veronii]|uniref:CHAT domain-containing protein n=1 Tax=Aeromonas veronii TaxID=654 RepID=UPI0011C6FA3E|nr:CHAT domain-containing protein [Aeromonas veronii]MCR3958959.1 CHAT domain-containing protein [Aeromonas veronii]
MKLNIWNGSLVHLFIIPMAQNNGDSSIFQGFAEGLFDNECLSLLYKTICLPNNIVEVFMNHDELFTYRKGTSSPTVILLDVDSLLKRFEFFKDMPFVSITYFGKEFDYLKNIKFNSKYQPIFISNTELSDVNTRDSSIYMLDDIVVERMKEAIANNDLPTWCSNLIQEKSVREKTKKIINIVSRSHGITLPNDAVLESLGYAFEDIDRLIGGSDKEVFIDAMIDSANELCEIVKCERDGIKSELVVYSPSIYSHLYKFNSNFWNQVGRKITNKRAREFIMNSIFKNKAYSGFSMQVSSNNEVDVLMRDPMVNFLRAVRQFELACTSLAICSLSIANICPAIRLPNAINFNHGVLKDLESLSRSESPKARDLFNRKYKEFDSSIRNEIGDRLLEFISRHESITLCTDVPLEWVRVGEIPFMFTHEISKIHTTLGNQLLKTAMNFSSVTLDSSSLEKLTVIRSFRDADPIKYTLENALRHFIKVDNRINLEIFDVNSEEEMLDVIKNVNSSILIFDCHGNHGGSESHGWLQIGSDRVDIWQLSVHVPPIVILSACLTSAVNGSHASVANGFLDKGALTVLGTLLPVDSIKAAVFIGRIAYRLTGYLDAIKGLNVEYLTWRNFMSGFFKMSYCTDILSELRDEYKWFSSEQYNEIHFETNCNINACNPKWFDILVDLISGISNKTQEEVKDVIKDIGFVETMNYAQIGRPENIIIKV